MLHWLIDVNLERIEDSPLSFLRLLLFPEFQALLATLLCFLSVLGLGGPTIRWLVRTSTQMVGVSLLTGAIVSPRSAVEYTP